MLIPENVPDQAIITFPEGLPGLASSQKFVILRPDDLEPIVVLQSVEDGEVSVPAIPVHAVKPDYRLILSEQDRDALGDADDKPDSEFVCLAVLILPGSDHPAACNLFAPVVINPVTMLGRQVVQLGSEYQMLQPLEAA